MSTENFFDRQIDFGDDSSRLECFNFFDKDNKKFLNIVNFVYLVASLLHKEVSEGNWLQDLFSRFDLNSDGKIDWEEFAHVWSSWIKPLSRPVTALLVVDVQNDFIDGSLALKNGPAKQDGEDVIPVINELIQKAKFDVVVYTMDYHPDNHISFFANVEEYELSPESKKGEVKLFDTVTFQGPPKTTQRLWPKHAVQGTWGARLHKDLNIVENSIFLKKGQNPKIDSYSAFWAYDKREFTELHDELKKRQVTHVFVSGLAYDYCSGFTALDALELGYATVFLEDAVRGIDPISIENMRNKLMKKLCVMANSTEIEDLLKGKDIKIEFARLLGKSGVPT